MIISSVYILWGLYKIENLWCKCNLTKYPDLLARPCLAITLINASSFRPHILSVDHWITLNNLMSEAQTEIHLMMSSRISQFWLFSNFKDLPLDFLPEDIMKLFIRSVGLAKMNKLTYKHWQNLSAPLRCQECVGATSNANTWSSQNLEGEPLHARKALKTDTHVSHYLAVEQPSSTSKQRIREQVVSTSLVI